MSAVRNKRTQGLDTGALGHVLWTYRNVVRVGLASLVAIYLLFKSPISGSDVVFSVGIGVIAWLAAELLAAPPQLETEPEVTS